MRGGALRCLEQCAALAQSHTVAATPFEARRVRVRRADGRAPAGAGGSLAVLRMEGRSDLAIGRKQHLAGSPARAVDVGPFQAAVPLAMGGVAEMAGLLGPNRK